MSWVLRCVERTGLTYNDTDADVQGCYLASYDVDAFHGRGRADWTPDIEWAMRFANVGEALEAWRQQSVVMPLRADGKPNRPLTAYSVEPVRV